MCEGRYRQRKQRRPTITEPAAEEAELLAALTGLFVTALNTRSIGGLLPAFAPDVRLVSEAAETPLDGRVAVANHFRRHLDGLRDADPVNVVAARGSVAFRGVDAYPCAVVFDGRRPASLICLEAVPLAPEAGEATGKATGAPSAEIRCIHLIHDRARLDACHTDEPPLFRVPRDQPDAGV